MYQPILKGKPAEFTAWKNVSSKSKRLCTPLFEIHVDKKPLPEVESFRDRLLESVDPGDVIAIDAATKLPASMRMVHGLGIYTWLHNHLGAKGIAFSPVLNLSASSAQIRDALTAISSGAANLTLRVDEIASMPTVYPSDQKLKLWCDSVGLSSTDIDLLIDLGPIFQGDVAKLQASADSLLDWALANGPWRKVTLASGAFPAQITTVPKGVAHPIPRLDAALYNMVAPSSSVSGLRFGDYGVRDAVPTTGNGRGPLPNIRYTSDTEWLVWREKKHLMFPNSSIYKAYAGIVSQPAYRGPTFSWGDHNISTKSTNVPAPKGAGTATDWIGYGLSQHVEFVVDRLSTIGVA